MWTVIYIAPTARQAKLIEDRLTREGFLVKLRQASSAREQFEILIPESELDEGQEVLKDVLHSSF